MLAAHAAGLGSGWIGFAQSFLNTSDGKNALGLPPAWVPVAPIIVGYPKPAPPPSLVTSLRSAGLAKNRLRAGRRQTCVMRIALAWTDYSLRTIKAQSKKVSDLQHLIVVAHPAEDSFTMGLTRNYAAERMPYAFTSSRPMPTTLEQRIAYRPDETSRAEAVWSSSPRRRSRFPQI